MKIAIARYQEGICLNDYEYVLDSADPDADITIFTGEEEAKQFLISKCNDPALLEQDLENGCIFFIDLDTGTRIEIKMSPGQEKVIAI